MTRISLLTARACAGGIAAVFAFAPVAPAANVPETLFTKNAGMSELLRHAEDKALTSDAMRQLKPGPRDLNVFGFFQDRMPPDAEVRILVSQKAGGMEGNPGDGVNLFLDGWQVAIMRGRFAFGSGDGILFQSRLQTGGAVSTFDRTPHLVAVLSSNLSPLFEKN